MANDLGVSLGPSRSRFFDGLADSIRTLPVAPVRILRGRPAVMAMHGLLVELSGLTGQTGAMDALDFFLKAPTALEKTPYLLLVGLREGMPAEAARADDLHGAVLVFEYRFLGLGTGVFATDDVTGGRTVIAAQEIRTEVAELACRSLLDRDAAVAMITLEGEQEADRRLGDRTAGWMTTRRRAVPKYLPLAETVDGTLALLGNDTRRNFRRYRRRLESELGAEFVSAVEMEREEFLAMNRASTNPVEEAVAVWRYESLLQVARPMFCGVRDANGRWLSLIGGRRQGSAADIDWQMNRAGMARFSLSTAMRAFLLEHEIGLGTERLVFEGGTPHSMRHSFTNSSVVDVVTVRRGSPVAWLLSRISQWVLPRNNFLGAALRDQGLTWTRW